MISGPMPGDPIEVQRFLDKATGRCAYDVGANQGGYTRGLATRFEQVIACEPADESFELLQQLEIQYPNVTAIQTAVSDHYGTVELNVQANSIRSGQLTTSSGPEYDGLSTHTWGKLLATRTVHCDTLDLLAAEFGPPDFLKVDVEGHEVQVIEGGLNMLARCRPALYLEIHNRGFGDRILGLIDSWYPAVRMVRHPHYPPDHWGYENHYWLIAEQS